MVARHDLTTDPGLQEQLLHARRGTAFFARKLNELSDAELDGDSLLAGWSRRHVVAHIGYNARAIARLVEWASTGVETPMYPSVAVRDEEINFGATLSPIALRNLFDHSAMHLSVEWRDLCDDAWHHTVRTIQGREVPASETVWLRSREVWVHAVDLDNGASFGDMPVSVLERLLRDITSAWSTRGTDEGLLVKVTGTELTFGDPDAAVAVAGPLAAVVQWATGRGTDGVTGVDAEGRGIAGQVPAAPKWI
ncbi:maleylpyruvate isomerase family mycothiol-dependent enzyme [Arthrobacter bambusae]|uniref:maleylpyruvate isomerase family mycothiol-dependent enzyme n=1 Tax=Arthrobacter bambusae TaxID=1338426 RepID=UPI002783E509|nr:maleylpyruvate isomerase family mycothiol-dependent enzyme [Arthrobacter bambusae]MDQ0029715.1 maleylpyruvate isomerase [Arthrobacter bambusae]MDQ0097376.1 maleylpyruvate isomerase [Arthrobacter bambusae]